MKILALETSGLAGSVALWDDQGLVAERGLETAGRRHAQTLLAEVHVLLATANWRPAEMTHVAVSRGPGSFTGLRVGVVVAKTWAYASGATLLAIDTFAALATALPRDIADVWMLEDAQRDEIYAEHWQRANGGAWHVNGTADLWPGARPVGTGQVVEIETFVAALPVGTPLAGPGWRRLADQVHSGQYLPATARASGVAQLAAERAVRGDADDPWTLSPFYIRPSAAEEKLLQRGG